MEDKDFNRIKVVLVEHKGLDDKQKNNKLDYLLKRLRKAGKIWTERNEVTSVWHLTEK